jgi:hypothetical protein
VIRGNYPFLLPQSLTISTWIKPGETTKESPIFAKGQNTLSSFVFGIAAPPPNQARATTLWMTTDQNGTGHKLYLDAVEVGEWQHLALVLDYQEPNTIARMYVNGEAGTEKAISGILYDELSTYKLGASYYNSFVGQMFSLEVFNYAVTDLSVLFSENCMGACAICPVSGECIEPDA